ncbi:MAG: trypsin-like peptidase domain-containing protein [Phycisphaerales bacterium]|nr:trypsin-like peptidase domain-containing protein [Phycisphaerales bacterium]
MRSVFSTSHPCGCRRGGSAILNVLAACSVLVVLVMPVMGERIAQSAEGLEARRSPAVRVFENARDAVVNISATQIVTMRDARGYGSMFDDMFDIPRRGQMRELRRESCGSGFVIHPDGYIVTNAHVVARTAERKAVFADGREFDADIIAFDTARDLAILKINPGSPLPTLPLGRSNDLMIGETVIAIGNPLGLQTTVTVGVVSALDRDLDFSNGVSLTGLVQTDASINPGNSGGPLLNVLGELIGINSAIRGDAQNIGFAIPVDELRKVLPDLLDVERRYGFVTGLRIGTVDEPRVIDVVDKSPADRAGVRPGDTLVSINGAPVREGVDFYIALIGRHPGEELQMTVQRQGRPVKVSMPIVERPRPDGNRLADARLGLTMYPLPPDLARQIGLRQQQGLLVTGVEPGSPADQLGIREEDVLVALARRYVGSMDSVGQVLDEVGGGSPIDVTVLRADRRGLIRLDGVLRTRE